MMFSIKCLPRCLGLFFALLLADFSTLAQDDYQYDLNGNLAKDRNKGLDTIIYNSLNLVEKVVFTGGKGSVSYSYDALGNKLSKTVVDHTGSSTSTKTTSYVEGVEYDENQALQFVTTEEGRVVPNGPAFQYEYNLKDHLGNVRVRFMEHPDTHQPQVLQTQGYYPFGGEQASMSFASGTQNLYLLNGKEKQEELNVYDFGARQYDPNSARWIGVDPLSEKYYSYSPYNYVLNNPLKYVDPDGRKVRAVDAEAEKIMIDPLAKREKAFLKFNKNGYVRKDLLDKAYTFFDGNVSESFNAIRKLAGREETYHVKVARKTDAKKATGEDVTLDLSEVGYLGVTLFPMDKTDQLIKQFNAKITFRSPDNDIWMIMHSEKSEPGKEGFAVTPIEVVTTWLHELSHSVLYSRWLDGERVRPLHDVTIDAEGKRSADRNIPLINYELKLVNEGLKNYIESQKKGDEKK